MDAIEFFQAIEGGAEYRVQDIPRLIEDDYDRENAERMFADFVCASGKSHLLKPPPGGGTPLHDYNPNQPRDWRGRWTKAGGAAGLMTFERYSNLVELLRETDNLEDLRWAQRQLGEELISERYLEGTSKHNRTRDLYGRTGGNPYNLEKEMAELRGKYGPDLPHADLRTKTETEIEAEWDQFNKAMEAGDRSLAPPGGIERMNALMNEIERRQQAYEAARLENVSRMSDDELSEFVEVERKRYVDDVQSMSQADRTLYRRARGELERRESDRIIAWREEARLRIINEELSSYENMSTSDLTTEHMRANEALLHSGDGPATPHSVMLQTREQVIREELRVRNDIAGVGSASISNLETWANFSDNPRLSGAAKAELLRRRENLLPLKQAVETDFENAKSMILETKGGVPKSWPEMEPLPDEDDPDFDPYYEGISHGAADELQAMGVTPADVMKPYMAKYFYDDDGRMMETRHSFNVNDERNVEIEIKLTGVTLRRTISYDEDVGGLVVSHDYFGLADELQGNGLSKEVMTSSIKAYDDWGVRRIDVHADINKGGYVWARYGFVPDSSSWEQLRYRFEQYASDDPDFADFWYSLPDHDDPKTVWSVADNRTYGKKLLLETDWYGSIDYNDDEVVKRFKAYAAKG